LLYNKVGRHTLSRVKVVSVSGPDPFKEIWVDAIFCFSSTTRQPDNLDD